MKQIFKITFPNNKIYIGKDLTGSITCLGDFNPGDVNNDYRNIKIPCFTIRKEVLWESESADDSELREREAQYIKIFKADNPKFGYNQ